jgi:hypothetical protein
MKLLLAIPLNLRAIRKLAAMLPALLAAAAVMYLAFGLLGAAVLTALVFYLGRLLLQAARTE